MVTLPAIGLLVALAAPAQDAAEMPAAWKQKTDAARAAQKSGDPARAEALLLEVVREAEKFGPQDLRLAGPLENLGCLYAGRPRKQFAEAEPLLRRALAIREKVQGPDHPDLASTIYWLSFCLPCNGGNGPDPAVPLLQRAIANLEKKNKEDPDIAGLLQIIGLRHLEREEYAAAEPHLLKSLAIREKASGPESADAACALEDLGSLHLLQSGSHAQDIEPRIDGMTRVESPSERHGRQAAQYLKRALAIREKILKPDDPYIAETLFKLGQLAEVRERPADGEPYLTRWLALEEKAGTPPSRKQAGAFYLLAQASQERKDWPEAERRLARTQAILEALPEARNDDIASLLSDRADLAVRAGRFDDAERFLRRSLEIWTALLGPEDPDIVQARELMAGSYRDHLEDRRAPMLWGRLEALSDRRPRDRDHFRLEAPVWTYAELLRRSNRALPPPTDEDLAYLKKAGLAPPGTDLDSFLHADYFDEDDPCVLDGEDLAHVARLYQIRRLRLTGITDAGLAHAKDLVMLRDLDIWSNELTDAGLKHLDGLESLDCLGLTGAKVTAAGVDRLRRARPGLKISYTPGSALEPRRRPIFDPPGSVRQWGKP